MLRIQVRDASGQPAAGLRVRIEDAGVSTTLQLDATGRAEAPLAGDGPTTLAVDDGALVFAGETLAAEAGDRAVAVGPTETLITLAAAAGLPSWRCIWGYAPNAELRAQRLDPFRVQPGDFVRVPASAAVRLPAALRAAGVAVLVHHREDRPRLDLALVDSAGVPAGGAAFRVEWDDGTVAEGRTGRDGRLLAPMPRGACTGTLHVLTRTFRVEVAGLPPPDTATGVQLRLNALNYFCGAIDAIHGPRTQAALRAFQRAAGLPETGVADVATATALEKAYGA